MYLKGTKMPIGKLYIIEKYNILNIHNKESNMIN
jgi:hypothetical protein